MSITTATSLSRPSQHRSGMTGSAWGWSIALGLLFICLYYKYFERLLRVVTETRGGDMSDVLGRLFTLKLSADWAHVLVIPFFSLYYMILHWREIRKSPKRVYFPGLGIFVAAVVGFVFWVYPGRNDMLQGLCMVASLFGLVLFVLGPSMMRVLWFPIAYLVFSIKISERLWDHIAWKLQGVAAEASTVVLRFVGMFLNMDAEVRGSTIDVWTNGVKMDPPLNVAEACSGLRMLMAFVALGVAIAFMYRRAWWQRAVMVLATVPIAVLINVGRVSTIGVLYAKVNPALAGGDFHMMVGMFMLIPAAGLFLLLGWVMERVFVSEQGEDEAEEAGEVAAEAAAEDQRPWAMRAVLGVAAGVVIGVGTGLLYRMLWGIFQPKQMGLAASMATLLLALSVVVLLGGAIFGWWVTGRERRGAAGAPSTALGMVAGILVVATVGFGEMVEASQLVLIKERIDLRHELRRLPVQVGEWEMVQDTPSLAADVVKTLGTEQYVMRVYRDKNAEGAQAEKGLVRLHVAYYTGTPDSVPHVPDRCFLAGGIRGVGTQKVKLELAGPQYEESAEAGDGWLANGLLMRRYAQPAAHLPGLAIEATAFAFEAPERPGRVSNVIYFFVANGRYLSSPDEVRLRGFDPRDHYSYHCKVELQLPYIEDTAEAAKKASEFLSSMMPEIMACLPDWVILTQADPAGSPERTYEH